MKNLLRNYSGTCFCFLLFLQVFFSFLASGQINLVPNPGFESVLDSQKVVFQIQNKPDEPFYGDSVWIDQGMNNVANWTSPNAGTPDLYFFPKEGKAKTGSAMAGLLLFGNRNNREYLVVELTDSLKKGFTYELVFYCLLSAESGHSIAGIGAYFSKEAVNRKKAQPLDFQPQIFSGSKLQFFSKNQWMEVAKRYIASGGERFLILGNFQGEKETPVDTTGKPGQLAYYFFDDISLTEVDRPSFTKITPDKLDEVPEKRVLQRLFFSVAADRLADTVVYELNRLSEYLIHASGVDVLIVGHADTTGNDELNDSLSLNRAQAVANYLILRGVQPGRVTYVGAGSKVPIADNRQRFGRVLNRRVEVIIQEDL